MCNSVKTMFLGTAGKRRFRQVTGLRKCHKPPVVSVSLRRLREQHVRSDIRDLLKNWIFKIK